MAEFTEVCRQAMRMNAALAAERGGRPKCIILRISKDGKVSLEGGFTTATAEEIEKTIMQWAAEHPEPVYPTWEEWQNQNFPDAAEYIYPCVFDAAYKFGCKNTNCTDCRKLPIRADIAEALGIKPIKGGDGK